MAEMHELVQRVRDVSPRQWDVVLAVALSAAGLVQLSQHDLAAIPLASGVVFTATVAVRHRAPALACVACLVAGMIYARGTDDPSSVIGPVVFILNVYALGSRGSTGRSWVPDIGVLVAAVPAIALTPGDGHVVDVVTVWTFFFVMPYAAGRVITTRRMLSGELRANAERLEREQHARAAQARADERSRIARELHDIVAHNVSVMVIQTVAARRVLPHDPGAARDALGVVERCGREALGEMRRMVGAVSRGDLEAGARPPGLAQLDDLLDRARTAGLPVELHVDGRPCPLPSAVDLVVFRVVQEALTNVIKHAGPARARVRLRFTEVAPEVSVSDDGQRPQTHPTGTSTGSGLAGMGERLASVGGRMDAGRRRDGGFRVRAQVPLVAEAVEVVA